MNKASVKYECVVHAYVNVTLIPIPPGFDYLYRLYGESFFNTEDFWKSNKIEGMRKWKSKKEKWEKKDMRQH